MEAEARICYYLGANAPTGFYSLYDQMLDPEKARDIRILKGGPGCGKSTLMKQVGRAMEEAAVVDGTAPHVVEPQYPGLVESYVDLGACYDRAALQAVGTELKGCMKGYKACYARAYRCLTAAAQLEEDGRALLLTPALEAKMAKRAKGILSRELKREGEQAGRSVQRFLGAVTSGPRASCPGN